MKNWYIYIVWICLLLGGHPSIAQDTARFRQWLDAGLYPLKTVDPNYADNSDLAMLEELIGQTRVVALGEESFGDGNSILTKVRIAKYLIQNMGFEQIIFEGGIYDLHRANIEVRNGKSSVAQALDNSLFPAWSESAEFAPLVDFLHTRATTGIPIALAGMDIFHNGVYATDQFVNALNAFLEKASPTTPDSLFSALDMMFARMETWPQQPLMPLGPSLFADKTAYTHLLPNNSDSVRYYNRSRDLIVRLKTLPAEFQQEGAWWIRMIQNIDACVRVSENIHHGQDSLARQVRDSMMAENAYYLLSNNKKTIIWGNNYHFVKNISSLKYKQFTTVKTVAHRLREKGIGMYSIATTAALGSYKQCNLKQATQVFYSSDKSLEFMLLKSPSAVSYLDLHGDSTLMRFTMNLAQYVPYKGNWATAFDGVAFVKEQEPCTLLRENAPAERRTKAKKSTAVYGEIHDSDTDQRIPYAIVQILGTEVGAVANDRGEFILKVPDDKLAAGYVRCSAVGYTDLSLVISSLNLADTLHFSMNAGYAGGLQPIDIEAKYQDLTASKIVKRAISKLDENYIQVPLIQEAYYSRTRRDHSDSLCSEEALMDIYDIRGLRRRGERAIIRDRNFRLNLVRRTNWPAWNSKMKITIDEIMRQEAISRKNNILSYRRIGYYDLKLEGVNTLEGKDVFVITYSCKKPSVYATGEPLVTRLSGRLYITPGDYAVVRHETDIEYLVRLATASDSLRYATLARNRHLVYIYRSDGKQYSLRYASQKDVRSYTRGNRREQETFVSELKLVKADPSAAKPFRGRWQDLDPNAARNDEKLWQTWLTNSLIDDWGME